MPAATAAPDPPLDPPGTRSCDQGLRVPPRRSCCVVAPHANSWLRTSPTGTAPASRSRVTATASACPTRPAHASEPAVCGHPATSNTSFTATGTPWSGERDEPDRSSAVARSASALASSTARWVNAPRRPSRRSIRSRHASNASAGVASPRAYASVSPPAERRQSSVTRPRRSAARSWSPRTRRRRRHTRSTVPGRLPGPARRHPGQLARHLRIDGRPGRVGEAGGPVPFVEIEERVERLGVGLHDRPRVAAFGDACRDARDREPVGLDRVELVPLERRRHLGAGSRPDGPRPEDRLVGRVLVEVDEHAAAALLLPPRGGDEVGPSTLQLARGGDRGGPHLDRGPSWLEPHVDVNAPVAGGLGEAEHTQLVEESPDLVGRLPHH